MDHQRPVPFGSRVHAACFANVNHLPLAQSLMHVDVANTVRNVLHFRFHFCQTLCSRLTVCLLCRAPTSHMTFLARDLVHMFKDAGVAGGVQPSSNKRRFTPSARSPTVCCVAETSRLHTWRDTCHTTNLPKLSALRQDWGCAESCV